MILFYNFIEFKPIRGHVIDTIALWPKAFYISMSIKRMTDLSAMHHSNVFRFTIGGAIGQYGNRCPALFLKYNSWYLTTCMNSVVSVTIYRDVPVPLHVFSHFYYEQRFNVSSGEYIIKVFINNALVKEVANSDARDFSNVKVYLSDDAHPQSDVIVKDFKYGIL